MRDNRAGECLWYEWSGDGFSVSRPSSIIYYTYEHIDIQIDVIARALASALQRDGIVVSLGDGYKAVERGYVAHGFAGEVEGEIYPTACDQEGNTNYGEVVKNPLPVTWMEII